MLSICLLIVLAPLVASIIAGLFGRGIGRNGAHTITIVGVGVSFVLSLYVFWRIALMGGPTLNVDLYTWLNTGGVDFKIGFLIDQLTATMMVVVTFVS